MKKPTKRAWRKWIKKNLYSWDLWFGSEEYHTFDDGIGRTNEHTITRRCRGGGFSGECDQELNRAMSKGFIDGFIEARRILHSQDRSKWNTFIMFHKRIRGEATK